MKTISKEQGFSELYILVIDKHQETVTLQEAHTVLTGLQNRFLRERMLP